MKRFALGCLSAVVLACGGAAPPAETPSNDAGVAPSNVGTAGAPSETPAPEVPTALRAVVDAPDRDHEDKALDAGRKPAELLAFAGVKPGMKVAELAAGGGYTAELLARAVGPSGTVYGQNSPMILERFAAKPWAARIAKPVNKNVVSVTREFDAPLPTEAQNLDAVFMVLFYHDTYWMKTDQAKMNAAIFLALKPGGVFIVVDHSAVPGKGTSDVQTTHRIEESVVRADIQAAGFRLIEASSFLRNPADTRDWNAAPRAAADKRGTSDRFVLKFVKP